MNFNVWQSYLLRHNFFLPPPPPCLLCSKWRQEERKGEEKNERINLWLRCRSDSHLALEKSGLRNIVYDHTLASFSYLNEQRFNYQMMTVSYGAMMAQGV